jgi:DNA-binding transcriptional MerR regulator
MGKYSIRDLEKLSGIKAHTIRIWEKRHHLIEPQRTPTNIRYYSDNDLRKIISVSVLNNHGLKISKIVNLSDEEINRKVAELSEATGSIEIYIEQLVMAMVDMVEEQFEKILSTLILKFGFERTVIEIIYPFLEKIGVLWLTNNITPAQEHFISNLIRQKLMVAIDGLPLAPPTSIRVLLFLPENELHELGLLFYYYLAKQSGLRTYYLGQSVPYSDLKSVFEHHQPHILISAFTTAPKVHEADNYLQRLSQDFRETEILVTGQILRRAKWSPKPNIRFFDNVLILKEILSTKK